MALDPKPVGQHTHAIGDIPVGRGAGKIALYEPGTNVTFTNSPTNPQAVQINAVGGPGGGVLRQFTWISGVVSVPAEGLYGTFAAAQAAAAAAQIACGGVVTLFAVGTLPSDITTIEAVAAYNMTNIELVGVSIYGRGEIPTLQIPNGVTFLNLARVRDLRIFYAGGGTLMSYATGLVGVEIYLGPNLYISPFGGGLPGTIIGVTGAGALTIYLLDRSTLNGGDAGGVIVDQTDPNFVQINAFSATFVADDIFRGIVGSTLVVRREGSSLVGQTQTGMLGNYFITVGEIPYQAVSPIPWQYVSAPPTNTTEAIELLVGSKTLFGAAFDPQNAFSVSQGAIQAVLSPVNGLVATGLLSGATVVSPGGLVGSNTPIISCGSNTLAVVGSDAYVNLPVGATVLDLDPQSGTRYSDTFGINGPTLVRFFSGFIADTGALAVQSDAPAVPYIGLQYSSARGDTEFQIAHDNGGGQVLIPTGVVVNSNFFRFDLVYGLSTGEIYAALWRMVPGVGAVPAFTTLIPAASGPISATVFSGVEALGAAIRRHQHARISLEQRMNTFNPS